jgi:hypothetical protein
MRFGWAVDTFTCVDVAWKRVNKHHKDVLNPLSIYTRTNTQRLRIYVQNFRRMTHHRYFPLLEVQPPERGIDYLANITARPSFLRLRDVTGTRASR